MTYALVWVVVFFCQSAESQTFNVRHIFGPQSIGTALIELDDRLLCLGIKSEWQPEFHTRLFIAEIDDQGEPLWTTEYGNEETQYTPAWDALVTVNDSTFVFGLSRFANDSTLGVLMWISSTGNLINSITFNSPYAGDPETDGNYVEVNDLIIDDDGAIYVTSQVFGGEPMTNGVLISKFSDEGFPLWENIYSSSNHDFGSGISLNNENVVVGLASFNLADTSDSSRSILTINRQSGLTEDIVPIAVGDIGLFFESILQGSLLTSASSQYNFDDGIRPSCVQVNLDGEMLWHSSPEGEYHSFQDAQEIIATSDGNFLVAGFLIDSNPPNPEINGDENQSGLLFKLNSQGTILWSREIFYLVSDDEFHEIYDLIEIEDGYVFCGQSTGCCDIPPSSYEQQTWIVKVDNCGCLVPGCDPDCVVSVNDFSEYRHSHFLIGPNPCADYLNLHLVDRSFNGKRRIRVLDLSGKVLVEYSVPHGDSTYILDARSFASGAHVLQLVEDDRLIHSTQFMKQ